MKIRELIIAALMLCVPAFGQIDNDPTAGISHQHGDGCNWEYDGPRKGDTTEKLVEVPGKKNEWTQKRVRYIRAGTGMCWSGFHQEACPCAFEDLEEVEVWYERTITEVEYSYVESVDVAAEIANLPLGADQILEGAVEAARLALVLAKKTRKRKVNGPWSPLPVVHKFKDICECKNDPKKPGSTPTTGRIPGYRYPGRGRGSNPTTPGPSIPPPFTPRPSGTAGGSDIPVPGTGPTTGGLPNPNPNDLPSTPKCKAGNDIPSGRFKWDYNRSNEWEQSITPAYLKFGPPQLCDIETKQDRYKWIKRVTLTGTLKGEASCSAKPEGHNGHGACAAGCDLEGYSTSYTMSWFRTLTFEPINGTITCSSGLPKPLDDLGSVKRTVTGTVGWKPIFGDWEVEVGSGTSGNGSSCGCELGEEPKDDEDDWDDEDEGGDGHGGDGDGSGDDSHGGDH